MAVPQRPKSATVTGSAHKFVDADRTMTARSPYQLQKEYNPAKSYTTDEQEWITSRLLKYEKKDLNVLNDYIWIVGKVIPNPFFALPTLDSWNGLFSSNTPCLTFQTRLLPMPSLNRIMSNPSLNVNQKLQMLRKYNLGTFPVPAVPPSSPAMTPPLSARTKYRSRPVVPKKYCTPLLRAAEASTASVKFFEKARRSFHVLIRRYKTRGSSLDIKNPSSGLPQMAGFSDQLNLITSEACAGLGIFAHTISWGFHSAIQILKDPNGLISLIDPREFDIFKELPDKKSSHNALLQIQVALDISIRAFERLGRSGSEGGWASLKGHNPELISPSDIQSIIIDIFNGFLELNKCAKECPDILRALIHCDKVEKSYLLFHVQHLPKSDLEQLFGQMETLRNDILKINAVMHGLAEKTENLIREICPSVFEKSQNSECHQKPMSAPAKRAMKMGNPKVATVEQCEEQRPCVNENKEFSKIQKGTHKHIAKKVVKPVAEEKTEHKECCVPKFEMAMHGQASNLVLIPQNKSSSSGFSGFIRVGNTGSGSGGGDVPRGIQELGLMTEGVKLAYPPPY